MVFTNWIGSAAYFKGEPLVYKKVDEITLDKEELKSELEN